MVFCPYPEVSPSLGGVSLQAAAPGVGWVCLPLFQPHKELMRESREVPRLGRDSSPVLAHTESSWPWLCSSLPFKALLVCQTMEEWLHWSNFHSSPHPSTFSLEWNRIKGSSTSFPAGLAFSVLAHPWVQIRGVLWPWIAPEGAGGSFLSAVHAQVSPG